MRRALEPSGDHASHFRELVHQVRLRVQPPGSVDHDDVAAGLDCVVGDRRRIRAALAADEARTGTPCPDLELLLGGCTERVCRPDGDLAAVLAKLLR